MGRDAWLKRISSRPAVVGGRPCIGGTHISVEIVLESLAEGVSREELLSAYPSLADDDITAALLFAAELSPMTVALLAIDVASL